MKVLLTIFVTLYATTVQGASVKCFYQLFGSKYSCEMFIMNPDNLNNFTSIDGSHLDGYTNADVSYIWSDRGAFLSENLPSIFCQTFPNIEDVIITNNGLAVIDDGTFRGCSRISVIALNHNRISSISANALANLPYLDYIDISYNVLTTLPENVFANQANVDILAMGFNPYESIPANIFQPLTNLRVLSLIGSGIRSIGPWFAGNALKNLQSLALGWNQINDIPSGAFAGLQNLQQLVLWNNRIGSISTGSFAGLLNLQELFLSDNVISELQPGIFAGIKNLRLLGLSGNNLTTLRRDYFGELNGLQELWLQRGSINAIEREIIDDAVNLDALYMDRNSCANENFLRFVENRNAHMLALQTCFNNASDDNIIELIQ